MKIVSLFSGASGLDLGLIQAGHEVIWANDIDKDAVATMLESTEENIDDENKNNAETLPPAHEAENNSPGVFSYQSVDCPRQDLNLHGLPLEPKSSASANSATGAKCMEIIA